LLSEQRQQQLLASGFEALMAGQLIPAAQAAEEILRYHRTFGDAWVLLCSALIKMESHDDQRALEDALKAIGPNDPARSPLSIELTRVLARRGRCARAVALADDLSKSGNLAPAHHEALGSAYGIAALFEKSLHHSAKAVELASDNPNYLYTHGLALRYMGKLDEAEQAFDRVIELSPNHALSYFTRADLKRWSLDNNHIDAITRLTQEPMIAGLGQAQLQFALFKELDDCKDYDAAWQALQAGCALAMQDTHYPAKVRRQAAEASIARFDRIFDTAAKPAPNRPTPIFVLGLPRSGTTLVERILARHPDVISMGESQAFPLALRDCIGMAEDGQIDEAAVKRSTTLNWNNLRDGYLEGVNYLHGTRAYCIDKLPHNYEYVGQIMQAFPNAKIVNLTRNPLDSLFGAYRVLFGPASYQWSYTQADLAEAYRLYRLLTAGWRVAFADQFIDVSLTKLIDNPETEIRTLLSRLDLDFDPACLSPEQSGGGVSTASSVQVRVPINRSGIGVWRNYARYLEPLRNALEQDGFVDQHGEQIV
jgi:Sulfotransferase family